MPERMRIEVAPSEHVTALVYAAAREDAGICLILAHGAGGNQMSPFMVRFATALAGRGIETITFNFGYSEQRRRLPDRNDKLEACWRAVIEAVRARAPRSIAIGGKSMGGRIASQIAAQSPDGIAGLVLLGYPLHPPGRPEKLRTAHLPAIRTPTLIVQGSRDAFGTPAELAPFLRAMRPAPDLLAVEEGDHSFKVPKGAAMKQAEVDTLVLDTVERWVRALPHT